MLTEESIMTAHDPRFTIWVLVQLPGPLSVNFATFGVGQLPKVRVNAVNLIAVNTASPNQATIAQIKAFLALHSTSYT